MLSSPAHLNVSPSQQLVYFGCASSDSICLFQLRLVLLDSGLSHAVCLVMTRAYRFVFKVGVKPLRCSRPFLTRFFGGFFLFIRL